MTNLHQDLIDKAQDQASKAHGNRGGDRYVAQAIVYSIESNGRVEEAINVFNTATTEQAKETADLARAQVRLADAQVLLARVAIVIAIAGVIVAIILKYT